MPWEGWRKTRYANIHVLSVIELTRRSPSLLFDLDPCHTVFTSFHFNRQTPCNPDGITQRSEKSTACHAAQLKARLKAQLATQWIAENCRWYRSCRSWTPPCSAERHPRQWSRPWRTLMRSMGASAGIWKASASPGACRTGSPGVWRREAME